MATKSSNLQGNPYHDDEGKFTSADDAGSSEQKAEKLSTKNITLKENAIEVLSKVEKPRLKLKKGSDLSDIISRMDDLNQVSNIPKLKTANDIEQNIEKFFSKRVCDKLNEMYGATPDCSKYQFHPKSNARVSLNLFTCVLGKYRYKDNHAHILTPEEFDNLMPDFLFAQETKKANYPSWHSSGLGKLIPLQPIFRGITSTGDKRRNIIDAYGTLDLDNYDIYGNGMYGTNVYTTVNLSYAKSYGIPIYGILDTRNAHYMTESEILYVKGNLSRTLPSYQQKIEAKMVENGIDSDRASHIAGSFIKSVQSDMSLVSILLGLDFQVCDSHQRNILNLNKWYIKGEAKPGFTL